MPANEMSLKGEHEMSTAGFKVSCRYALAVLPIVATFAQPTLAQQLADYTLHPGDQLEVAVWKEPDLTKTVVVRPDGKFSFPLAGETVAVGRTVPQVQTEIANKLKAYIPEPVVTAAVTTMDGNRVYVIGQVNKPGSFVMNPRLTVLQALSLASGLTPFASLNDIIVVRGSGTAQKVLQFRYSDVSKGKSLEQNIPLEAGDVIVVP
jgi:polysaccharide export outer membrane protein